MHPNAHYAGNGMHSIATLRTVHTTLYTQHSLWNDAYALHGAAKVWKSVHKFENGAPARAITTTPNARADMCTLVMVLNPCSSTHMTWQYFTPTAEKKFWYFWVNEWL